MCVEAGSDSASDISEETTTIGPAPHLVSLTTHLHNNTRDNTPAALCSTVIDFHAASPSSSSSSSVFTTSMACYC